MIGTRKMGFTGLLRLFKSAFIQGFISAFTFPCSVSQPFNCFTVVYDGHFVLCYKRNFKQS